MTISFRKKFLKAHVAVFKGVQAVSMSFCAFEISAKVFMKHKTEGTQLISAVFYHSVAKRNCKMLLEHYIIIENYCYSLVSGWQIREYKD